MIDAHRLLRDAYEGGGGFEDASFLVKHHRETDEGFAARQEVSYFLNYVAPTVNSHVDPVFGVPADRDWKAAPALWESFRGDVDGNGGGLEAVMKRAALQAKLHGAAFLVVDNVPDQPGTLADALAARAMPYVGIVTPDRVYDFVLDRLGGFTSFSYKEPVSGAEGTSKASLASRDFNIRTWTREGWILKGSDGKTIQEGEHSLGRVPVVRLYPRRVEPLDVLPKSEFLPIARTNLHLFNLCSWLSEILRNQAFSILVYPSRAARDLTIGTNNALGYDGEKCSNAPAFIAPPADPAAMLTDQIDRLIQEIYRMARLSFQTGTSEASSGVAKAWDFEQTNQVLADFAANIGEAEADVVALFEAWTGASVGYEVEYPRDFQAADLVDELDNAIKAKDLEFGGKFELEIARRVMAVYFPKLDPKVFDEIVADLEKRHRDELEVLAGYAAGSGGKAPGAGAPGGEEDDE